jgi:hypothetical protein
MFHRLLGFQQPIPIPGQRLNLGQQRRRHRKRPPMGMLKAKGVGQHERVEPVVLDRGDLVTLPSPRRDPWRDRKHQVPGSLQVIHQQTFGPFHRNR